MKTIPINVVKAAHKGFFFVPGTMRWFDSKVHWKAFLNEETNVAYFVSSEQAGTEHPRLYSVRSCDMKTGGIKTVGLFQGHPTLLNAIEVASMTAKGMALTSTNV